MREEAARAALPILADLHENGLDLESLSELRDRRILKRAVPIQGWVIRGNHFTSFGSIDDMIIEVSEDEFVSRGGEQNDHRYMQLSIFPLTEGEQM